jgi:hypothetical protein
MVGKIRQPRRKNGHTCKEKKMAKKKSPYVMVRTYSAGVFAGYLKSRKGQEVVLTNARRIWYWSGAASLSQLAQSGTSDPQNCKFPEPVSEVTLLQAIEIIPISSVAQKTIEAVPIWKK